MNKTDLSGKWKLSIGGYGETSPVSYSDEMYLPDTLSNARKGNKNDDRESGHLTDPYKFEGMVWFGREFDISEDWRDKELYVRLERTRMTALFADGQKCGECDSLCTPHIYKLPSLGAGTHRLDIRVTNTGYPTKGGHMTSPDTQTNWIGITGAIELIIRPKVHIDDVTVLSGTNREHVAFSCIAADICEAHITVDGGKTVTMMLKKGENKVIYTPGAPLSEWDEFSPELHDLRV
ncbi:MAG: beta-galactosidase, partial [Ruminiclostridium sp.]|nr:beta-galactosidase [Ruminiclostridium sp.]